MNKDFVQGETTNTISGQAGMKRISTVVCSEVSVYTSVTFGF